MCIATMRRVNHLEKILLFILGCRKFAIVNTNKNAVNPFDLTAQFYKFNHFKN